MTHRSRLLALATTLLIGCGGATNGDIGEPGEGGSGSSGARAGNTGSGGSGTSGSSFGGAISFAGRSAGGSAGRGVGGSAGNGADPRCPPMNPAPVLLAEAQGIPAPIVVAPLCPGLGLTCTYNSYNRCLCAFNAIYGCVQADPSCGLGGSGAFAPLPPLPQAGAGGSQGGGDADIALPPNVQCTCNNTGWVCATPL